jgi:hypothetical protein
MSRRLLQIFAALNALVAIYKGGVFVLCGIDAVPVIAGVDLALQISEAARGILDTWYRVLGWIEVTTGLMLAWITPAIETHTAWFRLIFVSFMCVGVGRLASVLDRGFSTQNTAAAIAIEIAVPLACIAWQRQVTRSFRS